MKRILNVLSCALLVAAMLLTMALPAFAADSVVTYSGKKEGFAFSPGSEYTDTDLFDNFKGVLPGDVREETITFQNKAKDSDYVKLYLRAEAHDARKNPLSDGVEESGEDVASMKKFLSQLTMRVYHGKKMIYEASPDELDGLKKDVYLGTVRRGKTAKLRVELEVPVELGSEYANRAGEVDWVFKVEAFDDSSLIQTGQLNWPIPVMGGLGTAMVFFGLLLIFGKRKRGYE